MKCADPKPMTITRKDGTKFRTTVPCGKCIACLHNKAQDWFFRLNEEFKKCESAYFITLTYDDACLPMFVKHIDEVSGKDVFKYICRFSEVIKLSSGCVYGAYKKDIQLFLKRLRKDIQPFKVRYFVVSEYGPQTCRPHYHMILFDFPRKLDINKHIEKTWLHGFYQCSELNEARIRYTVKYTMNSLVNPEELPKPFLLCSKGLGVSYLDSRNIAYHEKSMRSTVDLGDVHIRLPRYLKEKIFTEEELRELSEEEQRRKKRVYRMEQISQKLDEDKFFKEFEDKKKAEEAARLRAIKSAKKRMF